MAPSGTTVPSSAAAVAAVASGSAADFEAAVEFSKNAAALKKLPLGTKLELYALYKQGNLGPCKDPSPALWDFEKREKWCDGLDSASLASTSALRARRAVHPCVCRAFGAQEGVVGTG